MIARLSIVLSALVLLAACAIPALSHRSSGRIEPKNDRPSLIEEQGTNPPVPEGVPESTGSGSRAKSDREPVIVAPLFSVGCN